MVALEIIERYDVSLIYIGPLERAYYSVEGLDKFKQMEKSGHIKMIYQNPGVDLYRVMSSED